VAPTTPTTRGSSRPLGLLLWLGEPALLILSVKRLELRHLRALGLARPKLPDFGIGSGAFVVACGVTHLHTYIFFKHIPPLQVDSVGDRRETFDDFPPACVYPRGRRLASDDGQAEHRARRSRS
jgi:hypothetical protein